MSIETVDYFEIYAYDGKSTLDYLAHYGFRPVATSDPVSGPTDRHSTVLAGGPVHLVVTTPRTADSHVAAFLDAHGDGVADVAMGCADLDKAVARAEEAGMRVLSPPHQTPGSARAAMVSGFGAVRHTLVERDGSEESALPPGPFTRLAEPRSGAEPGFVPRACDHIAVCVPAGSLLTVVQRYENAFGLEYYSSEYVEFGAQAMNSVVVRSSSGGVTFTMIEPDPHHAPGQIDQFLAGNKGAGVQHIAFLVDDIIDAVRTLRGHGVSLLDTPDSYYDVLENRVGRLNEALPALRDTRVLADKDEWGYLLQIFSRSPYPRSTLFFELIQRNAARGFGSNNIRALYEAVERDRRGSA